MSADKEIAFRIMKRREDLNYSREYVSEMSGLSTRFLFDVETGKKSLSIKTLVSVCEALMIAPSYVLFGKSDDAEHILFMLGLLDERTRKLTVKVLTVVTAESDGHGPISHGASGSPAGGDYLGKRRGTE